MSTRQRRQSRWVVCLNNDGNAVSLERGKLYRTLPDRDAEEVSLVRVVDETGEDYLFPKAIFEPIQVSDRIQRALRKMARPRAGPARRRPKSRS